MRIVHFANEEGEELLVNIEEIKCIKSEKDNRNCINITWKDNNNTKIDFVTRSDLKAFVELIVDKAKEHEK
jgi:protein-tyrosine phosphatase